jgi:hypothetical protein
MDKNDDSNDDWDKDDFEPSIPVSLSTLSTLLHRLVL